MKTVGRWFWAWGYVAFTLSCPLTASAHLGHQVVRAERYLKVDVASDHVRVVVSLSLGPAEVGRLMQAADGNGDFDLSQAEADAYMAEWAEGLRTDLPLQIDGEPVAAEWGQPYFDPIGQVRSRPGAVELIATLPVSAGTHVLQVTDNMGADKYDRTDVRFQSRDGGEVLRAGDGADPQQALDTLAYGETAGRGLTDDLITVEFRVPRSAASVTASSEDDSSAVGLPGWVPTGVVLLVVGIGLGTVLVRRRRGPRKPG